MKRALVLLLLQDEEDDDIIFKRKLKQRQKKHEMFKNREKEGAFNILVKKHLLDNELKFMEYFRISRAEFSKILNFIENDLVKEPTHVYPKPISASEKLAYTLRYLATGESLRSLAFQFRICHNYLSPILKITLMSICNSLVPLYLPELTKDKLQQVAKDFLEKWNFPNCVGAIDGKHCRVRCPPNSGSVYYNYKHFFSIVLMAVVDADCKFLCFDIGSYGKEGDSGIFSKSNIGKNIETGKFPFPNDSVLPRTNIYFPHFLIGDGGFKLLPRLMKTYPNAQAETDTKKRQYNYRLSRARRTVESAFGILSNVFRVFHTPILLEPRTVDYLILACCCLHNMLIDDKCVPYINNTETTSTDNWFPIRRAGGTGLVTAVNLRNELKEYVCSAEGSLAWQ